MEVGDRDSIKDSVPVVTLDALKPLLGSDATATAVVTDLKNSVFQITATR